MMNEKNYVYLNILHMEKIYIILYTLSFFMLIDR